MTTTPHPTEEAFARFRRGELPPQEVARVGLHLADCEECAAAAAWTIDVSRSVAPLRDELGQHLTGHEIVAHVDGAASNEERARATEHLASCDVCRRDVDDLRAFSRRYAVESSPSWRRVAAVAAVALLAVVIAAAVVFRRQPAVPRGITTPVDPLRAERDALVAAALREGIAKPAVLVAVDQPGQTLRGVASGEEPKVIEPAGVVVEDTRPLFRWSDAGAASVSLSLFCEGRTIMRVATLHGSEWKPEHALERGKVYRWQIEVTTANSVLIVPGPADHPALFAVLSDDQQRALDAARARLGSDDLFLGVLMARNGLQSAAVEHLGRYCRAHPEEMKAAALLHAIEAWRAKE